MPANSSQALAALAIANQARFLSAKARKALTDGEITLEQALAHPDLQTTRLERVLRAIPGVGPYTAASWVKRLDASPMKRVGELTPRQRGVLLELDAEPSRRAAARRLA